MTSGKARIAGISGIEGEASPSDAPILQVVGVTKDFEGVRALDGVGFTIRKGHIKALIGPNGAGKTTLLNVINGLFKPDRGHVFFKDHDLVTMRTDKIGLLGLSRTFQLIRLFSVNNATVLDNVMIGAHRNLQPTITGSLLFRGRTKRKERSVRARLTRCFVLWAWKIPRRCSQGRSPLAISGSWSLPAPSWPSRTCSFLTSPPQG